MIDRRRVPLSGSRNARDLGGYVSRFGGRVRWGRVYRSGRLDGLGAADVAALRALDLSVVYDLRSADERATAPDTVPSIHVPLLAAPPVEPSMIDAIVDAGSAADLLVDMNLALLEHAGSEIGSIVFSLADAAQLPMLFHCTAGKDRTGLVAAVLLDLLGVARDDVLDDYELSALEPPPADLLERFERMIGRGVPREAAAGMLAAPRSVMATTLRTLDERYGGTERYLAERGAIDRGAIAAIRASLLA